MERAALSEGANAGSSPAAHSNFPGKAHVDEHTPDKGEVLSSNLRAWTMRPSSKGSGLLASNERMPVRIRPAAPFRWRSVRSHRPPYKRCRTRSVPGPGSIPGASTIHASRHLGVDTDLISRRSRFESEGRHHASVPLVEVDLALNQDVASSILARRTKFWVVNTRGGVSDF